jgi:hypothetical protein
MKKFVLAAACVIGLGFAASTGASAAPLAAGLDGVNFSPIHKAQTVVITPGHERWHHHRPRCERVTRCRIRPNGVRVCRTEKVCRD